MARTVKWRLIPVLCRRVLTKNHFDDFEGEAKEVSKFDGEVKSETTVKGKCDIKCHEWKLAETSIILLDMNWNIFQDNAPNQKKMMSLENLYGSGNHNRFPGFFVL